VSKRSENTEQIFGDVVLRMFRNGNDTLQIAERLHIHKPSGRPDEAQVCDILWAARARERQLTKKDP
jgi:hypothetical protein